MQAVGLGDVVANFSTVEPPPPFTMRYKLALVLILISDLALIAGLSMMWYNWP